MVFLSGGSPPEGHHGMIVRREGEIICKTAEENFWGRGRWGGVGCVGCGIYRFPGSIKLSSDNPCRISRVLIAQLDPKATYLV